MKGSLKMKIFGPFSLLLSLIICLIHFPANSLEFHVGANTGNAYSIYAITFSKFLEKRLGEEVIVRNNPGAGGLILYKRMDNEQIVKPDGETIAMVPSPLIFQQSARFQLNLPEAIDSSKFRWIGSLSSDNTVLIVNDYANIRNIGDMKKQSIIFGAPGASADFVTMAKFITEAFNLNNANIVRGYSSLASVYLSLERNETNAIAIVTVDNLLYQHTDKYNSKKFIPIIVYDKNRDNRIPDVPTIFELLSKDSDKLLVEQIISPFQLNRAIFTSKNISEKRLKQLREAFSKIVADKEYIDALKQHNINHDPKTGEQAEAFIGKMSSIDKQVFQRLIDLENR